MTIGSYAQSRVVTRLPVLPLDGTFDLTYRCNNDCRHCWVRQPVNADIRVKELSLEEIRRIVGEAKALGQRNWVISGGEPMIRSDFIEIFRLLKRNSIFYTLNTNATRITPEIAALMKEKGANLVALYGADAKVHDGITGNPGSFAACLRGMSYLIEAGAPFIVQLIPLKSNFHQWRQMIDLALKYSDKWRIGAPWLYFRADRDSARNRTIAHERLSPGQLVQIDKPPVSADGSVADSCGSAPAATHLLECSANRNMFHIDPYGKVTFCEFVRDPRLRFDLREGGFREYWEGFRPTIQNSIEADDAFRRNCGSCKLKNFCSVCPAAAFLEHGEYTRPIPYLCDVAAMREKYTENFRKNHRRFYHLGGMTLQVDSEKEFSQGNFIPELKVFRVEPPGGSDRVVISHRFSPPTFRLSTRGKPVYDRLPWKVFNNGDYWTYLVFSPASSEAPAKTVIASRDHTVIDIYHEPDQYFSGGNFNSLTLLSSDQILLSRTLIGKNAFFIHSSGLNLDGKGYLFVGHSEAGKSTICKIFHKDAEILCDDRNIIRRWPQGFRLHGTWSHGELPDVSPRSVPLKGIFFLNQSRTVKLEPVEKKSAVVRELLKCVVRPVTDHEWWVRVLDLLERVAEEIPCYNLYFDKSDKVIALIRGLSGE